MAGVTGGSGLVGHGVHPVLDLRHTQHCEEDMEPIRHSGDI